MPNTRAYRTPTRDDDPDVPVWFDRLASDVASDVDAQEAALEAVGHIVDDQAEPFWGILDKRRRRTVVEVAKSGDWSDRAYRIMGRSAILAAGIGAKLGLGTFDASASDLAFVLLDKNRRKMEFEIGQDGKVTQHILDAWASRMGTTGATAALDFPSRDWAHWGDSMTASGFGAIMATLTGRNHYNGGRGGQKVVHIAARQGGVPALLTVTDNTIPASGPVTVSKVTNPPLSAGDNRNGTLAGIPGRLALAADGAAWTFTRDLPGVATPCPADSRFTPQDGLDNRGRTVTIWAGRNGIQHGDSPADLVQRIRSMIDYLTPRVRRVIVMQIAPDATETPGTPRRILVDAGNAQLAAAFPGEYLAIADYLRTPQAATDAGVVFTADDQTDIANKVTPRSLRLAGDGLHLNNAGNTAVAKRLYAEALSKGWI